MKNDEKKDSEIDNRAKSGKQKSLCGRSTRKFFSTKTLTVLKKMEKKTNQVIAGPAPVKGFDKRREGTSSAHKTKKKTGRKSKMCASQRVSVHRDELKTPLRDQESGERLYVPGLSRCAGKAQKKGGAEQK